MATEIFHSGMPSRHLFRTAFLLVSLMYLVVGCGSDNDADSDESSAVIDGAALYEEHCSSCHLSDGDGDIGPSMFERVPNLTETEMTSVINEGTQSEYVSMPGFDDLLSDAETAALVEFIYAEWGSE